MKRAFTLLELLVVIAIMGIMGSLTVSGYRQMRRGMEERTVMQNVNQFIRSAYQRAQIDRQNVAVYFWNETLQSASGHKSAVVVGKAVAVRRSGRISRVQGSSLYDEFGDLKFNRKVINSDEEGVLSSSSADGATVDFYRLNGDEGNTPAKSSVYEMTERHTVNEPLLVENRAGEIECYAFVVKDKGGVDWKVGDAYGFEFSELTLPHGYIFGSTYSKTTNNPIAGEDVIRFKVSANSGSGATGGVSGKSAVQVSSLRPDKSGNLTAQRVANSDSPTSSLRK